MAKRTRTKKSEEKSVFKLGNRAEDLKQWLPPPPLEHAYELKMEERVKRLVEGEGGKFSEGELRFYSRQMMLDEIGYGGQERLKEAKVCLVGLGGLGSTIAFQLAAMGVGHLRLVDRDVVEESNLQRQHLYSYDVIGYPKVEAAVNRLERLNPYVEFEPLPLSFEERNASDIISGMDVVVDGLDNMNTRYAVNRACIRLGVPYVFGAAISTFGNVSTIVPGETACLECFYGKLEDQKLPSCATVGVHPSVIGVVASIEVAEAVKTVLNRQARLRNKLLYCDVGLMRFEEIEVARVEKCPVCGSQRGDPAALKHSLIEEGCGRNNRRVFILVPKENLNLDLANLVEVLKREGAQLNVVAKLGVTYVSNRGFLASMLKSGVMVLEGASSREDAVGFYRRIIVDKLNVPWVRIE